MSSRIERAAKLLANEFYLDSSRNDFLQLNTRDVGYGASFILTLNGAIQRKINIPNDAADDLYFCLVESEDSSQIPDVDALRLVLRSLRVHRKALEEVFEELIMWGSPVGAPELHLVGLPVGELDKEAPDAASP